MAEPSRIGAQLKKYILLRRLWRVTQELSTLSAYCVPTLGRENLPKVKYVVFCEPRTGSRLLSDLLNCHPDVECGGGLFDYHLPKWIHPKSYVERRYERSRKHAYGFLLHPRQILMMPIFPSDELLSDLHAAGWRIIHLKRRNTLRRVLSWEKARRDGIWHAMAGQHHQESKLQMSGEILIRKVRLAEIAEQRDELYLDRLPHLDIVYEDDLLDRRTHQTTLDTIFEYLGLPPAPVSSKSVRTSSGSWRDMIANHEELETAVINAGYGRFLVSENASGDQGR